MRSDLHEVLGEPISVYTGEQAVADGLLVDTRGLPVARVNGKAVNRVTRAVWAAYAEPMGSSKITGPVTNVGPLVQALSAAIGAGKADGDWLIGKAPEGRTLWFVPNEGDGYTAMFPDDY